MSMSCDECGEPDCKILIPVYTRSDVKKLFQKKNLCLDCFSKFWEPEPDSENNEDNKEDNNGDDSEPP